MATGRAGRVNTVLGQLLWCQSCRGAQQLREECQCQLRHAVLYMQSLALPPCAVQVWARGLGPGERRCLRGMEIWKGGLWKGG